MSDDAERTAGRRFRAVVKVILLSISGTLVILLTVWLALDYSARRAVEHEIEKIRAKGEPISVEELLREPGPGVPDLRLLLDELTLKIRPTIRGSGHMDALSDGVFGPMNLQRTYLEQIVRTNAEAMVEAKRLASSSGYGFGSGGWEAPRMPLIRVLRELELLFAGEARLRAYDGNAAGAAESLNSLLDILRLAEARPQRAEDWGLGFRALHSVLRETERLAPLPDDERSRLIARLLGFDIKSAGTDLMIAIRADTVREMNEVIAGTCRHTFLPDEWRPWRVWAFPFLFHSDMARVLGRMTEVVEASRRPPWEALRPMGDILEQAAGSSHGPFGPYFGHRGSARFSNLVEGWAARDVAVLGLALGLCGSRRGHYPERLDALVPEFLPDAPVDPFTGKRFAYRLTVEGCIAYSVGADLKDDGGVPGVVGRRWWWGSCYTCDTGDIVWEGGKARAPSPTTE